MKCLRQLGSLLLAALFIFGSSRAASAQVARVGDTVRVHHPMETEGILVLQDGGMLGVRPLNRPDTIRIAQQEIVSIDRRSGTHRLRWTPLLAGVGTGAAIGAIAGYAAGDDRACDFFCLTARGKAGLGGVAGGIVGALVGGVVALIPVTTYVPVIRSSMSLRVAPVDQRLGLAMRWQP